MALLLPHFNDARDAHAAGASTAGSTNSTVNTALLQRTKLLQEENDELYELLKHGEVSKINDEVRGLRRVVSKLEMALKGNTPTWLRFDFGSFMLYAQNLTKSYPHCRMSLEHGIYVLLLSGM